MCRAWIIVVERLELTFMSQSKQERQKKKIDKENAAFLQELLNRAENLFCADCNARGPRWASFNFGCFLCIRCAGLHRKLGTHISKIKSCTLDSWAPEQLQTMMEIGNQLHNQKYLAKNNAPIPNVANDLSFLFNLGKWKFLSRTSMSVACILLNLLLPLDRRNLLFSINSLKKSSN